jgi:subtilisin family serine protease
MKRLVAIGCLLALSGAIPGSGAKGQGRNPAAPAVPGEILIQYHPSASFIDQIAARGLVNASQKKLLRDAADGALELVTIPDNAVGAAIAALQRHPAVRFAEPNYIFTHTATSNDPFYTSGQLWGMYSENSPPGGAATTNQFGSAAEMAWDAGEIGSHNVVVAVIDTGLDFNHPDLNANIWTNPFDPIDGIDNDGNGRIDDRRGWDFFHNDNTVFDPADGDAHATHVAGTIGAEANNGIGVVGVNWNVTIIPIKFLGPGGGSLADAVLAIDYATDLKTRHGINIVATNNSWGCLGCPSTAIRDAIVRGAKQGILFVAAAGNNNNNNDFFGFYPAGETTLGTGGAGYEAVTSVAAITEFGFRAGFSNFGATTVDIGAPGAGIISTTPNNTYSSFNGTSMASPHVAGAVALLASFDGRGSTPAAANARRMAILNGATPTPSLVGLVATNGRLDIENLLGAPPPPDPLKDIVFTSPVTGCKNLTAKVTLNNPAPPGGQIVNLTSANAAATVPAQVTVAEGKLAKSFTIVTTAVAANTTGNITASIGSDTASRSLTVRPIGMKKVVLSQTSIKGGNSLTATATLACPAGPGPITATLSSDKPGVANPAVSNLVFNVGEKSKTFTINTSPVSSSKSVVISATANGKTKKATLTVNP